MSSPSAAHATSLLAAGGVQSLCGVVLALVDIIGIAAYGFSVPTLFLGIIFGLFYIITGSLGAAAGNAAKRGASSGRCLAVGALVMSILSILNSFALLIFTSLELVGINAMTVSTCRTMYPPSRYPAAYSVCVEMLLYGSGLLAADVTFLVVMFITSIAMCVVSSKAMASFRTMTTVTHVTHVGQPGMVYGAQPYNGYPQVPYGQQKA